jgi:hypothetical protein
MIAADFGQTFDFTAVAVVERRLVPVGDRYQHYYYEQGGSRPRRVYEARQNVETSEPATRRWRRVSSSY